MKREDFTRAIKLFEEHKKVITILSSIERPSSYSTTVKLNHPSYEISIDDDKIKGKVIDCIIQCYKDRLNCINNQLLALDIDIFEE